MNLLKYQSFLESNLDINSICEELEIKNYTINDDGTIDVNGNVSLAHEKLTKLPLKFRHVTGWFDCSYNQLTTLKGGPKSVGGFFNCSNNQLTSLIDCTVKVGGNFSCADNQLTTLKGGPEVGGNKYFFRNNQINDLTGFPEFWEGNISFGQNPISTILSKFPGDKVCKAIYWMNEFGVTHGGKINKERLEEVFITLGLEVNI